MLKVESLCFRYRFRSIFENVSFEVHPGELLHITGPNGCGKTTLISVLAGLSEASSGSIEWKVGKQSSNINLRRQIEYLPAEANALYAKMDALSNLRFWLELRNQDSSLETIRAELDRWGLDHPLIRENFPVEKFSTGMKRRLAIARVHLSGVPCWLLDEPLYGLDTSGIETFQDILKEHLSAGGFAIVVSHDAQALEPLKPRVYAMSSRRPQ